MWSRLGYLYDYSVGCGFLIRSLPKNCHLWRKHIAVRWHQWLAKAVALGFVGDCRVTVMRQRSTNYCQNDGWTYLFAIMRVRGDVEHCGSSPMLPQSPPSHSCCYVLGQAEVANALWVPSAGGLGWVIQRSGSCLKDSFMFAGLSKWSRLMKGHWAFIIK